MNRFFISLLLLASLVDVGFCADSPSSIKAEAPAEGIKLLSYNDAGYRYSMLRGTQAHYVDKTHIDVSDMTLTLFVGDKDNTVDTILLSPLARAALDEKTLTVHGDGSVRLIKTDDFEVSGQQWTYKHPDKHLFIEKDAHVIIHAAMQDLLK